MIYTLRRNRTHSMQIMQNICMAEQLIWQMMTGTDALIFISCRKFLFVQQQLFEGLSEISYREHTRRAQKEF